jgi:polyhydroxyalkanoate synthase
VATEEKPTKSPRRKSVADTGKSAAPAKKTVVRKRASSPKPAASVAAAGASPQTGAQAASGVPPFSAMDNLSGVPGIPGFGVAQDQLLNMQKSYLESLGGLWSDMLEHPEKIKAPIEDNRFADPAWQENPVASFLARSYLLNAEYMARFCGTVDAEPKTKARLEFAVSQWIDAAAPSNFFALNPAAQKRVLETQGQSLVDGLKNLMGDVAKGKISQADESAFEVGVNVATSEGAVVYENDTFQLIQYKPLTDTVRTRPFLLVPPCINKFYILDLQAQNSFVRFAVEKGNTVFIVSWKNPKEEQARWTWDHYVENGPIQAIDVVQRLTGQDKINMLGFCVGGTLLSTALAVLAARGKEPAASVTLLTALLDFTDTGILDIFIDETHVSMREAAFGAGGLMPGRDLANTFSSLRANDLVWNYVVNNYLAGQRPPAFDLLYWNGDSTNLPGPMYAWYLRNTYLENRLREPGSLTVCGEPVDLGSIHAPVYALAAREDHIVPWNGAFISAQTLTGVPAGQLRFVLAASGHIAGTINPASKNRRNYWVQSDEGGAVIAGMDSGQWFAKSTSMPGSWWNDWDRWLAPFGGKMIPAPRQYGGNGFKAIEPAPGRYVKERA